MTQERAERRRKIKNFATVRNEALNAIKNYCSEKVADSPEMQALSDIAQTYDARSLKSSEDPEKKVEGKALDIQVRERIKLRCTTVTGYKDAFEALAGSVGALAAVYMRRGHRLDPNKGVSDSLYTILLRRPQAPLVPKPI